MSCPIGTLILLLLCGGVCGCIPSNRNVDVRLTGIWHAVREGDSLSSIASQYHTSEAGLAELNDLDGDDALHARSEIFVPRDKGGSLPGTGARPAPPKEKKDVSAPKEFERRCGKDATYSCLAWPLTGEIVQRFGKGDGSFHDGIDISAELGATVLAADSGTVIYSGDEIKGYGNIVILRHPSKMITVYAHNQRNLVKEGDRVTRAQPIALVGKSGGARKPHLHFELRLDENPANPMPYLEEPH